MEKRIKDRFDGTILQQAMQAYNIAENEIHLLDGFESFIYEFQRPDQDCILRIGHSLRRSENLIRGEVDWINYLHRGGASVSRAILAENGSLVVPVDDGGGAQFLVTAFTKAKGNSPGKDDLNPGFYRCYGRLLGKMHALTKSYQPAEMAWKRFEWDGQELYEIQALPPEGESRVIDKYSELRENLDALPRSRESYGLIHQDAHLGNLFIDQQGEITLFDFDDCAYSWFINDIAIVLFYIALGREDQAAFTRDFMTHFLSGYMLENEFDNQWLQEIPHFLKLREIDLYAVIHRSFDVDNIDHPWVAMFMENRKQRIVNDVPFIDFDFSSLSTME
jgi:Ser/Thr protein kinase RdoA (MazF antagonist)